MSDLSRESRDVIEAGARALAPSDAARAKIRAAVATRVSGALGEGGGPAGEGGVSSAAASGTAAKIWLAALVVGGIAVGVLGMRWYLAGPRSDRPAAASASGETAVAPAPPPAVDAPTAAEPPTTSVPAGPSVPAAAPGRARSSPRRPRAAPPEPVNRAPSELEHEVALLSEARRALGDGEPGRALAALARHRRELPAPQMAKEAALLRAEALCAADRAGEGRAVLAEIDARWPGATGAAAVRTRCHAD